LDKYGTKDLNIAMQLESVLSCTAEKSTISSVCDFYKDDKGRTVAQHNQAIFNKP